MNVTLDTSGIPLIVEDAPKEMLSVTKVNGKTKVKINSSSLSILQECGRKAQYVLHDKLRKTAQNPATLFGSAIHAALEEFYRADLCKRVLPKDYKKNIQDMETMPAPDDSIVYRAAAAFIKVAEPLRGLDEHNKRSIPAGLWMLGHYFEAYIDDPFVVFSDEAGPMVERRVDFTLYEDDALIIEYFGTIDVVLQNQRTGLILVADHKTSSVVGNDFFNRLKPNHQYTGYLLGAKKAMGIDTDSFMVNCLQVKPKPKTARGGPPHFLRQVTRRDENDYLEFTDTVVHNVRQFLTWLDAGNWTMGHTSACAMYGGCQFLEVCSAPKEIRANIIAASFNKSGG